MIKKSLYECHVFVCTNKKDGGRECCADKGSAELHEQLKTWAKENYGRRVRVNKSGCLDFCAQGICTVIYPNSEWHLELKKDSLDEMKKAIESVLGPPSIAK